MVIFLCTPLLFLAQSQAPRQLEILWADLATSDPAKAHQAITAFVTKADLTVPFLQKQLRQVPRPDAARLGRLVADLDSDHFKVRESATRALEKLGEPAEAALRKGLAGQPPLEVRRRMERILQTHKRERLNPPPSQVRQARAIEVLEQIGTTAARSVLEALSRGAPEAPLTRDAQGALERLAQRPMRSSEGR